jgi:hypothetical protein
MIVVKDNILPLGSVNETLCLIYDADRSFHWADKDKFFPFLMPLIHSASQHFDLSQATGYEWWARGNDETKDVVTRWHLDKDENLYDNTRQLRLPLCSIIYYPLAANLNHGEFLTEDIMIKPKSNRAVFMSSDTIHTFAPFTGERWSFIINVWD